MKTIYTAIMAAGLLALGSCSKYLDVNENPNLPTSAPLNGLLGRATQESALNVFRAGSVSGNYVQYLTSPNPASASDIYEDVDASGTWTAIYNNMTDIYDMDKLAEEQGALRHQGVAKVLMAMNMKLIHDIWGDAPYGEAFTGATLVPAYDPAQTLHTNMIALLDEGIALLTASGNKVTLSTTLDFVHGGNIDRWVKTAYVLKARMLNQLSKTSGYNAANILAAIDKGYTSNADAAQVTVFSVRNPWAQVAVSNAALVLGGWLSDNVVNAFNGTTYGIFDPRIEKITDTTKFGDYRGTRNGVGRSGGGISFEECYLSTKGWYSSTNSPLIISSFDEMKFIEAEAALRANNKTRAYAAYLAGMRANFDKLGVTASRRDTYVNDATVSVGEANLTVDLIMREKYKALFLHPETWNDARRYDYKYKNFRLPANAVLSTFIRRLDYPSVELTRNGSNVPSVSGLDQKLWWDN